MHKNVEEKNNGIAELRETNPCSKPFTELEGMNQFIRVPDQIHTLYNVISGALITDLVTQKTSAIPFVKPVDLDLPSFKVSHANFKDSDDIILVGKPLSEFVKKMEIQSRNFT